MDTLHADITSCSVFFKTCSDILRTISSERIKISGFVLDPRHCQLENFDVSKRAGLDPQNDVAALE